MKKILFIFSLLCGILSFSQTQEEEMKNLLDLMKLATDNFDKPKILDSIRNEVVQLKSTIRFAGSVHTANKFLETLDNLNKADSAEKPIKRDLDGIDAKLKDKFRFKEDKFRKLTFITGKKAISGRYRIYPYLAVGNNKVTVRLKTNYHSRDWIFFKKILMIIDGENYTINAGETDRQVADGVYETSDILVDSELLEILKKIINTKSKVEYRLTGEYHKDYTLSELEIENLKNTFLLYEELIR